MLRLCIAVVFCALASAAASGQLVPQRSGTEAEFRALHAPSANVVWAGGRGGVYAVTTDGGATWRADSIRSAGNLFLTGVWAEDARTAYVVATSFDGGLARIYHTSDGGSTWQLQYQKSGEGVFFDALQCWNAQHCVAYSDPVAGRLLIVRTTDGATWTEVPAARIPPTSSGEAGFAASGTTLTTWGTRHAWIGTGGGAYARVYRTSDGGESWDVAVTPLAGNASAGIFGVAFRDSLNGVAVGGDYRRQREQQQNVLRTTDGGRTWTLVGESLPFGVRYGVAGSPVAADGSNQLLAVGPSGAGISVDNGARWIPLDSTHYNTVAFAPNGAAWLAGPQGRIAHVSVSELTRAAQTARSEPPGQPPEYPTRFSSELVRRPVVRRFRSAAVYPPFRREMLGMVGDIGDVSLELCVPLGFVSVCSVSVYLFLYFSEMVRGR